MIAHDPSDRLHYRNRQPGMDLSHMYQQGYEYGVRHATRDWVFDGVDQRHVLREDVKRWTLPKFRAWSLGALRGYRDAKDA